MLAEPSFPSAMLNSADFEISTSSSSLIFRSSASARSLSDTFSAMARSSYDALRRLARFRNSRKEGTRRNNRAHHIHFRRPTFRASRRIGIVPTAFLLSRSEEHTSELQSRLHLV